MAEQRERLEIRCGVCAVRNDAGRPPLLAVLPTNSEGLEGGTMFLRYERVGRNRARRSVSATTSATLDHARRTGDVELAGGVQRGLDQMRATGRAPARSMSMLHEVDGPELELDCARCKRRFKMSVKKLMAYQRAGDRLVYISHQGLHRSVD